VGSGAPGLYDRGVTYYEVLGVPPTASVVDIRRAYVDLARRHHPDFHTTAQAQDRADAERQMQQINEAWLVLGDAKRRGAYDLSLAGPTAPAADAQWSRPVNDPGWRPGTGTAHPDFIPVDGEDDFEDEDARQRWLDSLDDSPIGTARPIPRWQQLLPVSLLGAGAVSLALGFMVKVPLLVTLGVFLMIGAVLGFVLLPVLTVLRSYEREPDR
jgi:DnaJ domain